MHEYRIESDPFHLVTVQREREYTSRGFGGEPEKQRPTPSSHCGEIIGRRRIEEGTPLGFLSGCLPSTRRANHKLLVVRFKARQEPIIEFQAMLFHASAK